MVRRRTTPESAGQMAFDFGFMETAETIDRLQEDNRAEGDEHVQHIDPAPRDRGAHLEAADDPGGARVAVVPPEGLDHPGSMGAELPGEAARPGEAGRDRVAGQAARTAADGARDSLDGRDVRPGGADGSRDPEPARNRARPVVAVDYVITPEDRLGDGGPKAKFRDNVAALRALARLRDEGRPATPDDQRLFARYVGWGGLPQAFDH